MREIKFRVWNKVLKKFDPAGLPIIHNSENGIFGVDNSYVEYFVVQQYTGLTDRNGQEIYEGDIVRYRQHMFNTEKTRTKEKEIGFDRFSGCFNVYETNAGQDEHEVIGNIFEGVDK